HESCRKETIEREGNVFRVHSGLLKDVDAPHCFVKAHRPHDRQLASCEFNVPHSTCLSSLHTDRRHAPQVAKFGRMLLRIALSKVGNCGAQPSARSLSLLTRLLLRPRFRSAE